MEHTKTILFKDILAEGKNDKKHYIAYDKKTGKALFEMDAKSDDYVYQQGIRNLGWDIVILGIGKGLAVRSDDDKDGSDQIVLDRSFGHTDAGKYVFDMLGVELKRVRKKRQPKTPV